MHARIDNGLVAELIPPLGEFTLEERFGAAFAATCVAVPEGTPVAQGWQYSDGAFAPPPPPDPAVLAAEARAQRDRLLAACDWTQLPDAPLDRALRAAWAAHRSALRDVTQQPGFPAEIAWPAAPG